jgi:hypothetical protein
MDAFKKLLCGWEDLKYDLEELEKISVPAGCFVISASGVLQSSSQDEGKNLFWQVANIDIATCTFFRKVVWVSDCVHKAIKQKHGIINIGTCSMHVHGISIRDHWGNLVFAGKFKLQDDQVDWISPCRTAQEEQSVLESAGKILAEASFERQWANHDVAKELEIYANLLKGKVIHPRWKEPMLSLLGLKRKFS